MKLRGSRMGCGVLFQVLLVLGLAAVRPLGANTI
jgi:hypothetical protein